MPAEIDTSDSDSYSAANDEDEYEVEAIREVRFNENTGMNEFLIKWKNYEESENSWVLSSDLNCPKIVDEFYEQQRAEKKKKKEDKPLKANADRGVTKIKSKKKKAENKFVEHPLVEREPKSDSSKSISQNNHLVKPETSTSMLSAHEFPAIEIVNVVNPRSKKIAAADNCSKPPNDIENNVPPPNGKVVAEKRVKTTKNVENVIPRNSNVKFVTEKRTNSNNNEKSSSEEEKDIDNYMFNAKKVPCKIIENLADTGFSRGWEMDKILALCNMLTTDGENEKFMIVKFKGYKHAQQLPLTIVRENAPLAWIGFLKDLAGNHLFEKNNRQKL